jgi:hypothetical protein
LNFFLLVIGDFDFVLDRSPPGSIDLFLIEITQAVGLFQLTDQSAPSLKIEIVKLIIMMLGYLDIGIVRINHL